MRMTHSPKAFVAFAVLACTACPAVAQQTVEPVYRVANESAAAPAPTAAAPVAAPAPAAAPVAATPVSAPTPFDLTQKPGEHPLAPTVRVLTDVLNNIDQNVRDYTCTFIKQESLEGVPGEQQHIMLKVRNQPFSVYMKFLQPYQGREVLFVDGINNNEMTVLEAGWKRNLGKMNLDPTGMVAMRGQRHPVTEVGLRNLTAKLLAGKTAEMKFGECVVTSNPNTKIDNRPTTLIQVEHPTARKEFATHITRIFLDNELRVPICYDAYMWPEAAGQAPPLDARYIYSNLKLNVGLAAQDFDSNNPAIFQ
ncbi:MAG: DUF1571 domain-containing protein [Pirellulales bacterium]